MPISVISQIYPLEGQEVESIEHLPPVNLAIEYDSGSGSDREIKLVWEASDTELEIDKYNIYKYDVYLEIAFTEIFFHRPVNDNVYSFYVTAVYTDGVESDKSNEVTTTK